MNKQKNILITGTDTNIGKTILAAGLTIVLNACYWKPIQSGCIDKSDSKKIKQYTNINSSRILPEFYKLKMPFSPHYSAEIENIEINLNKLIIPKLLCIKYLIIEAVGGLMVPLKRPSIKSNGILALDLFSKWNLPTILCARTTLGTINHTLLSIKALKDKKIPIIGVVFIGNENIDNQKVIIEFSQVVNLGRLPFIKSLTKQTIKNAIYKNIRLDLI